MVQDEDKAAVAAKPGRRIENFGIAFVDGMCDGWVFGVPECHRGSLDIELSSYVDRTATEKLRHEKSAQWDEEIARGVRPAGIFDKRQLTVFRQVWTRGNPPVRSFAIGDVFYEPAQAWAMPWGEALKILRRSVRVLDGKADPGAGTDGEVRLSLVEYAEGEAVAVRELTMSQAELETLLRYGELPGGQ